MRRIPKFTCKTGCHDCCGLVPFSAVEKATASALRPMEQWEPFGDRAFVAVSALATMRCPFVTKDGCGIYEDRPMICRLFGAVDAPLLTCPHGCEPKRKLSDAEAGRLLEARNDAP